LIKSGIYKITILNNIYIGSSSNLARRLWEHEWRLKSNKHNNNHLQNVYNKYNIENFITEILEYCELEVLLKREQYYIDLLKPNLNKALVAGTTLGLKLTKDQCLTRKLNNLGRKHSQESIKKRVSKIKGRKYSEEHRKNISNSKKGKCISEEHKLKLINGNKKPVCCYNKEGTLIKIYSCASDTLIDGYTPTNVTRCCKNKLKTHKKLIWKYYEK
jgi:group I intron endonuclease